MTIHEALKKYYGYDSFRPQQEEIINNILNKNDTLVLMPTGGGKSLCFQIPAIVSEGITIVISPLIALMTDQVNNLKQIGVEAEYINSNLSDDLYKDVYKKTLNNTLKMLYVSPEKLQTNNFIDFLKKLNISYFAIDEAHCISNWGHDFRPDYTKLNILKEEFKHVPIIALTATADKVIRKDILTQLNISHAKVYLSSFDRKNLSLNVSYGSKKFEQILNFLKSRKDENGIIYCISRKNTEDLCKKLKHAGYKCGFYHAGMEANERSKIQQEFQNDEIRIITATIAFGMGIDKSNVRYVIHYNIPKNIENFYQEIGRAGRDGCNSDTILFYSYADIVVYNKMLGNVENLERKQLLISKMDRMMQYCTADVCRRKILLSYFNEEVVEDCGNCDVCKNPPNVIDNTILAQKILSTIVRVNQKVNMMTLIPILRGTSHYYKNIKTYGICEEYSVDELSDVIIKMLNNGFIDIAYDEKSNLKINNLSNNILVKGMKVYLSEYTGSVHKVVENTIKKEENNDVCDNVLLEKLKEARRNIAIKEKVPAYVVFTDKTLLELAAKKPKNKKEMLNINGIAEAKFDKYGIKILDLINDK